MHIDIGYFRDFKGKNLNVNLESLSNEELNNFEPTASSLISNIDIIEENLTLVLSELEK